MNSLTFVYGALRSGTTLLKLMLDSHEGINCPGEVDFIFDYLKKKNTETEWSYDREALRLDFVFQDSALKICDSSNAGQVALDFVNQLQQRAHGQIVLTIHRNADKAFALFPNAKFIHLIRDPRDVARSCIDMGWAGTAYFGVEQWLKTEQCWDHLSPLLEKRSSIELFYQDLIYSPEVQLKRVCSFLSLRYSSNMLSYSGRSTYGAPDPTAIEQWKRKLSTREVALVEIRVKQLLLNRHYKLSGYPLDIPGTQERIGLILKDRAYKWTFGCRRHGYFNFILEKITRKTARSFHPIFRQRINAITRQHVKR